MPFRILQRRRDIGVVTGRAAGFAADQDQYQQIASSSVFVVTGPIAIVGWVYFNTVPSGYQRIVTKVNGTTADEWFAQINPTGGGAGHPRFEWGYGYGVNSYRTTDWAFADVTAGVWHMFYGDINISSTNTLGISWDGGTIGYNNFQGDAIHTGTLPLTFGATAALDATFLDGRLDAIGFANQQLTQNQVNELYNNNVGRRFSNLPTDLRNVFVSWWDEDTTAWKDSTGNNHTLSAFNGVTLVSGKT